jgi:hypothetical protein
MTNVLTRMGLTRDSALFLWTKVASLSGLVVTGVLDPSMLGLTDRQKHTLMVVCGAIAYVSGQLSTSQLPAKTPPQPTEKV